MLAAASSGILPAGPTTTAPSSLACRAPGPGLTARRPADRAESSSPAEAPWAWETAINQGRHAARAMLGDDSPYAAQPYFYTDQYDWGMEYVGRGRAGDELVTHGDHATAIPITTRYAP